MFNVPFKETIISYLFNAVEIEKLALETPQGGIEWMTGTGRNIPQASFNNKLTQLIEIVKKKSRAWSVTSGLQLPTVRGSKLGSDKKILFKYDIVKKENKRYPLDNNGRKTYNR